jgi:hypothetical protein
MDELLRNTFAGSECVQWFCFDGWGFRRRPIEPGFSELAKLANGLRRSGRFDCRQAFGLGAAEFKLPVGKPERRQSK